MIRRIIEAELCTFLFKMLVSLQVAVSTIALIAALNSSVNKIVELLKHSKVVL